jgi:hypothetical protein
MRPWQKDKYMNLNYSLRRPDFFSGLASEIPHDASCERCITSKLTDMLIVVVGLCQRI